MKLVLRTVRKIFPFESVRNHPKRFCLYHHLNLCPCAEVYNTDTSRKEYLKTIRYVISFLDGDVKKVVNDLIKEQKLASTNEEFEKASYIQKQLHAIDIVTSPIHKPFDYESNPNLVEDKRSQELLYLQKVLVDNNIRVAYPTRIECYDISNIQGTNAVASMVVFTNGEKDAKWYRRFKMKIEGKPNDFAMMNEVITRRLKHEEWPFPQLIVVDGGKGQVGSSQDALNVSGKDIPLIGLAKRLETIVLPNSKEIKLPDDTPALHLLMRLRDEAHRFAITYHKKIRSKNALLTAIG